MYSPCLKSFVGMAVLIVAVGLNAQTRELRVCADPDNMPFSSRSQTGFENRIAAIVARDLNARLTFVWQRMGRGFVREYLDKGQCDLLIGIPTNYRSVLTTSPYYRSTYVFVSRQKEPAPSLNSPALHGLKIGVQVLDEQYTPPGEALARRGLQGGIVGFDTIGDGADSIVRAVADQKVDIAIVWGPLAGYFAKQFDHNLRVTPVEPEVDPPGLPFTLLALWIWHVPWLFDQTLRSDWIHAAQHTTFLATALIFWWPLVNRTPTLGYAGGTVYIFTTILHTSVLGALLTFAPRPWYSSYVVTAPAWHLTALEDQQIGGLIMWVPAGALLLIVALVLLVKCLQESQTRWQYIRMAELGRLSGGRVE